jgi:TetR/AcrR family transcriptional regulator, copper-responsive repressor
VESTTSAAQALHETGCSLLAMNIEAEKLKMAPSAIAEMVLSFFSGLCIERNLKSGKTSSTRKIENFMTALRSL